MSTTTTDTDRGVAERAMGIGLRGLNWLAGSDLLDRIRIRKGVERALFQGTKQGFRTATAAGRTFAAAQKLGKPARQPRSKSKGLFDVSPDDEQQMLQEAGRAFAADQVRPAAKAADDERTTPPEILAQATELGVAMLGIPAELGGVMEEGAATTTALIGEALAHGDMGIAYAALAPGAVATAIGLWGVGRAAGDLPAVVHRRGRARRGAGDARAAAALRPDAAGDEGATRDGEDWVLNGAKSLVARATRVRALRRRRRRRGHRSGALRRRVEGRRALDRGRARDGAAPRRHRPPHPRGGPASRPRRCSARPSAPTTSSACTARGSPGARSRSAPRRRSSTTSSPT